MNNKVFIELEVNSIIPMLESFRHYFDSKYPCTDESNDGNNMPIDDEMKYAVYDHLLTVYNKSKDICKQEYDNLKLRATK